MAMVYEFMEVGKPLQAVVGMPEGVIFDATPTGYTLIYNFRGPTDTEIDSAKEGQPFEIRFTEIGGVIWILSKAGRMEWTDAPFNPHLSLADFALELPEHGKGTSLTFFITDAPSGIIKNMRLIGLDTKFSIQLISAVNRALSQPFDRASYDRAIQTVTEKYSTKELVKLSVAYYKLR